MVNFVFLSNNQRTKKTKENGCAKNHFVESIKASSVDMVESKSAGNVTLGSIINVSFGTTNVVSDPFIVSLFSGKTLIELFEGFSFRTVTGE